MREKRQDKGETAAECLSSWPDIAWSGHAEQEHGDASDDGDVVADSSAPEHASGTGGDEGGEPRGAVEMMAPPAVPRKSSKRASKGTLVTTGPVAESLPNGNEAATEAEEMDYAPSVLETFETARECTIVTSPPLSQLSSAASMKADVVEGASGSQKSAEGKGGKVMFWGLQGRA
ncbi:hypothetical protein LTR36_010289, partial [Oleoguttula mirabilis]